MEKDSSLLDDYILSLTPSARPRVCFLPTASGDADHYVVRFYRRFSAHCERIHVSLFRRDQGIGGVEDDLATHLLAQDLIYVGGGNVVSMLGAWRAHGLDSILRRAWRRGSCCAARPPDRCAGSRSRCPRSTALRGGCAGSVCCPTPTASTTTPSPRAARSTTASSRTA